MSKRQRDSRPRQEYLPPPPPSRGLDALALATLAGVVGILMLSFSNWRELDRIERALDTRLQAIETRIGQVSDQVDKLPSGPAAQPARRRPDPNRVYQIKTAGLPAKGPAGAPVTIAEFSDFQ